MNASQSFSERLDRSHFTSATAPTGLSTSRVTCSSGRMSISGPSASQPQSCAPGLNLQPPVHPSRCTFHGCTTTSSSGVIAKCANPRNVAISSASTAFPRFPIFP